MEFRAFQKGEMALASTNALGQISVNFLAPSSAEWSKSSRTRSGGTYAERT